ncbi:Vacuolar protein sorting-associated protein 37A [Gryganskiella cystojenkinii]|nr:Vacuolar protein sorting-associated protein 37A [Gryganskiella cystojenkinii]
MTVYLPPTFPEDEPKITITPTIRHLWVDGTVQPCAVTGHERLMPGGWSIHANLGRIVKEIVTNIQRTGVLVGGGGNDTSDQHQPHGNSNNERVPNASGVYEEYSHKPPPPIPSIRSKSLGPTTSNSHPTPSYTSKINGSHFQGQQQTTTTTNSQYMNSSSTSTTSQLSLGGAGGDTAYGSSLTEEFKIVLEQSEEKIAELLESPIAYEHFVDHLDVVVNSRTLKAEWWGGNNNVARRTLALEAEMRDLQRTTAEGHKLASQLQKTLEEKLQQQQDALWRFKPEYLQSRLKAAASESDDLSESVSQMFLEGKLDADGFIKQYRELRKVYHLREMKNERIEGILRKQSNLPTGSNNNGGGGLGGPGGSSSGGFGSSPGGSGGGLDSIQMKSGLGSSSGSNSGMMGIGLSSGPKSGSAGLSLSTSSPASANGLGSAGIGGGGAGSAGTGGPGSAGPVDPWVVL